MSANPNNIKILVLILSSSGPDYNRFKEDWLAYANSHPSITTFFIEMNSIKSDYLVENNTMTFNGVDSIAPGCLHKTVQALKISNLNKYDYVVRTNLSSVVHYPRLYNYLVKMPRRKYYAGVLFRIATDRNGKVGTSPFCSGALFIMSQDVAKIVALEEDYENSLMYDDVHIGHVIRMHYRNKGGIELRALKRLDDQLSCKDSTVFHYRFKTGNRLRDTMRHAFMVKQIYNLPPIARDNGKNKAIELILSKIKNEPNEPNELDELDEPNDDGLTLQTITKYASKVKKVAVISENVNFVWATMYGFLSTILRNNSEKLDTRNISLKEYELFFISKNHELSEKVAKTCRTLEINYYFLRDNYGLSEAQLYIVDEKYKNNSFGENTEYIMIIGENKVNENDLFLKNKCMKIEGKSGKIGENNESYVVYSQL